MTSSGQQIKGHLAAIAVMNSHNTQRNGGGAALNSSGFERGKRKGKKKKTQMLLVELGHLCRANNNNNNNHIHLSGFTDEDYLIIFHVCVISAIYLL